MTDNLPAVTEDDDRPAPPGAEESALTLWAHDAVQANRVAQALAKTSFVPASMQGKPHDITAAILAGQEMGLTPMASLRSMDIINGNVYLRAHALRGLVQSHGHRIWVEEQTPTKVVVCGQRKESLLSFGPIQTATWTIERAEEMGLANKPEWKRQKMTMLTARATAELCRLIAADVILAMPYVIEEYDPDYQARSNDDRPTLTELSAGESVLARDAELLRRQDGPQPKRPRKPKDIPAEPITEGPLVDQPLFEGDEPEGIWPPTAEVKP